MRKILGGLMVSVVTLAMLTGAALAQTATTVDPKQLATDTGNSWITTGGGIVAALATPVVLWALIRRAIPWTIAMFRNR